LVETVVAVVSGVVVAVVSGVDGVGGGEEFNGRDLT